MPYMLYVLYTIHEVMIRAHIRCLIPTTKYALSYIKYY